MANLNFNGIIRGGVIRNMQILGFGADPTPTPPGPTPLQVSTSVRLNPADTPNVSFIPTLTGNAQTLTFSAWIKRSLLSSQQILFGANTDTNNHVFLEFQANDTIRIASNTAASTVIQLITTQVFRDPSQWYHLVLTFDLTNSTQADRVRLYINGARVTAFSTSTLPANTTTFTTFNTSGVQQYIGRYVASSSYYFGGYIADINLVDGQALTPAAFTETDSATGQLIPMTYSGSYGVNGFYLPFGNSATVAELGLDPKATGQDYPYWPYTTLLVNSIGTNGAQNNTFLDSSTNAFSITRNGNPTQGNFTPFNYGGGTAQTAGYYSAYFDGTGDYLTMADNAAFALGTNNFTIEAWVLPQNSASTSFWFNQWETSAASDTNSSFVLSITSGKFQGAVAYGGSTSQVTLAGRSTVSNNQWYHVALVRNGSSLTLYVNGQSENTSTTLGGSSVNNSNLGLYIGTRRDGTLPFQGYISNARLVNGTALYTSNFTVPTTPLTAVTNTQLLTCQSSTFIDNSTNAFTITAAADSRLVPTNPFGMTAWSGYFDGTGDYLQTPTNAALSAGTGAFTIELFAYFNSVPAGGVGAALVGQMIDLSATNGINIYTSSNALRVAIQTYNTAAVTFTTTFTLTAQVWCHIVLVRDASGVTSAYFNGQRFGTQTYTGNLDSNFFVLGRLANNINNYYLNGNLSNVRFVKGSAVYDPTQTTITVPTAPLTAIANTSLLTCQSSTFVDNSTNAFTITANGNAFTSTLNNPFNSPINYTTPPVQAWSTYFDGASQLQVSTTNAAFDIAGDFTVEGWFNVSGGYQFFGIEQAASPEYAAIQLQLDGSSRLLMLFSTSGSSWALQVTATPTYAFNQWNHLAITRSGSTIRLFQNGSVIASGTLSGALYSSGVRTCINGRNASGYITGSYSNFRFINGQALYTSNFTPSTEPLTLTSQGAQASQVKLLTCQSNGFIDNSLFNWPLTVGGTPQTQASSPFTPTTAYSAASYGGTMYLDGTGDSLSIPGNSAFDFGTGNFTAEAWVYPQGSASEMSIIDFWIGGGGSYTTGQWQLAYYNSNTLTFVWASNASTAVRITSASNTVRRNTWTHVAVTRTGNLFQIFTNGVLGASTTLTQVMGVTSSGRIGTQTVNSASPFTGYISGVRILKGTSLYPTAFVPPVAPPTAIANTSLLLNATNAGIYDAAGDNDIETAGNAQVSTAVKKWGESSVYFDGSGDYLSIQPSVGLYLSAEQTTATNRNFTIETWIYPTTISYPNTYGVICVKRGSTAQATGLVWSVNTSGALSFAAGDSDTGSYNLSLSSSNGAIAANNWYHVAVTRQGTVYRMFINGTQVATSTPTAFVIAYDITGPLLIGLNTGESPAYPWYGYMQDFRYTIGAARYQGDFVVPTAAFAYNQSDINNQQWTPTNISVTAGVGKDNLVDSPSDYGTDTGAGGQVRGNYATLNPLNNGSESTLSNGALDISWSATAGHSAGSTIAVSSGKWYAEFTRGSSQTLIGIIPSTFSGKLINWPGNTAYGTNSYGYFSNSGDKYNNSSPSAYGASYATGDVIGVALDLDAGTLVFYKNGVSQGVAYSSITGSYIFAIGYGAAPTGGTVASANFGQRAFAYAAPTGFKCLVSTNLPTPTIGATSTTQASDYVDLELWTGTGANRSITGFGFAPDFVWIKGRSQVTNSFLFDILRGATNRLCSSLTVAQASEPNTLTAFNSDGFSLGTDAGVGACNLSGQTYVGWCWKANGAGSTNTAGSITSTVSANTTSGCSVVTWTGNGTNGATIGHGLGVAPVFTIIKSISGINSWYNWHQNLSGNNYGLSLNTTDAQSIFSFGNLGTKTSTTLQLVTGPSGADNVNLNGRTYVAYCFAAVAGYSAFGSYTGNGSADGPFVYLGFRPTIVLYKRIDSTSDWWIMDRERTAPYNVVNGFLYPNSSAAEAAADGLDFLSNGFKVRRAGTTDTNASGGTYIYAAFAEFPFKYARAR